jgi:hypothetical protein
MVRTLSTTLFALALAAPLASPCSAQAAAQSLADRVAAAPGGDVRFTFAARDGVCGNGDNITVSHGRRDGDVWESDCEPGPVHVLLRRDDRSVTGLKTFVGGRWKEGARGTDLGDVAPQAAADYLLGLAKRLPGGKGEDAVFPATLARDVATWPALLRLARDEEAPSKVRQSAIFWLGQAAGEQATRGLEDVVASDTTDRELRESAVFALSRRPNDEGVPALIKLARSDRDPKIRRTALFWLGRSEDPRALALFEELLSR